MLVLWFSCDVYVVWMCASIDLANRPALVALCVVLFLARCVVSDGFSRQPTVSCYLYVFASFVYVQCYMHRCYLNAFAESPAFVVICV